MKVVWNTKVDRQLQKIPRYIVEKFRAWVVAVESIGLREARKLSGFHDEPLRGKLSGQRSVRLNRSYRVFYRETKEGQVELVEVIEVNKHEYKS